MRPGVDVISRAQPLPRSAPTDTGAAFMLGETEKGPDVQLVRSLTEYEAVFGVRQNFDEAYDGAESYFREGGAKLTVSRTNAGTMAAVSASEAADYEALTRAELDVLASEKGLSPSQYATKADIIAALTAASPAEAAVRARESSYDAALQLVDPGIATALLNLTKDYGPGQVFVRHSLGSDPATHSALLAHAAETNRVALLHAADSDAATLITAATALQADVNGRYGALFAPHVSIPGVAGGTTRDNAYPSHVAGMLARNDVAYNPNTPAAGDLGQSTFALDVNLRYSDQEYHDLNEAGVNMARLIYGGVRTYGWRTIVDPAGPDAVWKSLGWARLNMAIVAQAEAIGEHYVFSQIDGRYRTISSFGGDLRAMLVPFYENGALYGETADDAFDVNVGPAVNTPESIANGELHAVIAVRMSPFAEWVVIEVVKVATTEAIAA